MTDLRILASFNYVLIKYMQCNLPFDLYNSNVQVLIIRQYNTIDKQYTIFISL